MSAPSYDVNDRPEWISEIDALLYEVAQQQMGDAWAFDPRPFTDALLLEDYRQGPVIGQERRRDMTFNRFARLYRIRALEEAAPLREAPVPEQDSR